LRNMNWSMAALRSRTFIDGILGGGPADEDGA